MGATCGIPIQIFSSPKEASSSSKHGGYCSVSSALCLVLRASQVVGVAPVRIESTPAGHQVYVSRRLYALQIILMSVLNVASISGFLLDVPAGPNSVRFRNPTMRVAWTADIGTTVLTASLATYGGCTRLEEVIRSLSQLDKIRYSLGVTRADSREWRHIAVLITFFCIVCTLLALDYFVMLMDVLINHRNLTVACLYSSYEYSYVMVVLLEMQFVYSAMEVDAVLKSFNNVLENMLTSNKGKSKSKPTPKCIQDLTCAYDGICTVMQKLDEANNVALAILLGTYVVRLVITPYNFIRTLASKSPRSIVWTLLLPFWCVVHLINIIMLVEPPHLTQIQMDRTSTLISKLKNKFTDAQVSAELAKFSKYIALQDDGYSPLGICKLSRSVIHSILGLTSTYLVIIIQLQPK